MRCKFLGFREWGVGSGEENLVYLTDLRTAITVIELFSASVVGYLLGFANEGKGCPISGVGMLFNCG